MADGYNFAADLLTTWRSTADWVKAVGLVAFAGTAVASLALTLKYRLAKAHLARESELLSFLPPADFSEPRISHAPGIRLVSRPARDEA
ncbi:hypothetical protein H2509_05425 [Stappia sp. F7233]|uniref:Uncharacterized protein n=1 Tax=Stappia albiluteola TaxID=2758565 RepID=A0A839AC96_9HYPH|nr:hypothetical protein [Stappia albiluteola]MBA5776562.1 hypothetical protein [Stappia albiluteola]